jgi:hypothetical protein
LPRFQNKAKLAFTSFAVKCGLIFCLLIHCSNVLAQEGLPIPLPDSLMVKSKSLVYYRDSIFFIKADTLFIITPGMPIAIKSPDDETDNFYANLKKKLYKTRVTKEIYDLLFRTPPPSAPMPAQPPKAPEPRPEQLEVAGKIIRNIRYKKLDVFGADINDTTKTTDNWFKKTANSLHAQTRNFVLKNQLMLKSGDEVDPYILADNERIIRELPFIRDARILLLPTQHKDSVDLLLITEDVWSISVSASPRSLDEGNISIRDNNILGFGHTLRNRFFYNANLNQTLGYQGSYYMPNIRGSFVSAAINYANLDHLHQGQLHVRRPFFSPTTKHAGGLEISRTNRFGHQFNKKDSTLVRFPLNYDYSDLWLGKAFRLNFGSKEFQNSSRLVIAARGMWTQYHDRPIVTSDSNRNYHNRLFLLGSIGFSSRNYYKSNLVYAFGRTEDVPYGHVAEITGGFEKGEFYDRLYTGLRVAKGSLISPLGYCYGSLNLGGFYRDNFFEQGLIRLDFNFFSNLQTIQKFHLRQFLRINYTKGHQRLSHEMININNENGIRGFNNHVLTGTQRLAINMESIIFTPVNLLEFRIAMFFFADIGLLNFEDRWFERQDAFSGYGFGFRVRNENLALNTFQFRLAYYPRFPSGGNPLNVDFSGIPLLPFNDFNVRSPGTFDFY